MSPPEQSVVEIVEVIRRSEQGITLPFICRGDDDNSYFVKGVGAGRDSQIKEWIAGNLALSFGIPVAPFNIVYVPEELIELLSVEHARDLGTGPAFGSVEQMVTELSYSQVNSILPEVRRAVLFFDWWIFNADRMLTENGGNPNLFWGPDTQRLVVIDHNQAFDSELSNEDFFKLHVFKDCAPGIFGVCQRPCLGRGPGSNRGPSSNQGQSNVEQGNVTMTPISLSQSCQAPLTWSVRLHTHEEVR